MRKNQCLLGVLLAEIRTIRKNQIEQLQYDRTDAAKMAGPRSAAESVLQARDFDVRTEAGRVDRLDRRREHRVGPGRSAERAVGVERARVAAEVFIGPELRRVHEYRHHHEFAFLAGGLDQAGVSGVQCPHRGHEADALTANPGGADHGAKFWDRMQEQRIGHTTIPMI